MMSKHSAIDIRGRRDGVLSDPHSGERSRCMASAANVSASEPIRKVVDLSVVKLIGDQYLCGRSTNIRLVRP
jgi:hypothetical protein